MHMYVAKYVECVGRGVGVSVSVSVSGGSVGG